MLAIKKGRVIEIISQRFGLTEVKVKLKNDQIREAINYDELTGKVELNDEVILNTTAVELSLGTGGYDFILYILNSEPRNLTGSGHIMKLRYSPYQIKCLSVEEEMSKHREAIKSFTSLDEYPVIIGSLHSMLAPVSMVLDKLSTRQLRVAYVMTDAAALPIRLSNAVAQLKQDGLITSTITVGHAFGGDLEAVNIYSGLIAAKEVVEADVIIVAMGPGIVGTGTEYGFTGLEQGEIINAVRVLGGTPIAIPRISFSDQRQRHYGISHHSLTAIGKVALKEAVIGLPKLSESKQDRLEDQIKEYNLTNKHDIRYICGEGMLDIINEYDIKVSTMGRNEKDDPEFFMTVGISGLLALEILGT
ncbi:DUF3866 family protein [Selenihalanaerobacter shriftii]|uniref:DUF3866 domain-containing protein n=1 Tax=Selenihalanaerobacter shriftii TaxID=142842 RepID=A0A1T4M4H8_9FIRM|nr:DUF3866 family protein [Selenihalanaerobacter shriftii]SJZ61910.1 Protein of unknown function [Selenihalanaerobacter shriftii]